MRTGGAVPRRFDAADHVDAGCSVGALNQRRAKDKAVGLSSASRRVSCVTPGHCQTPGDLDARRSRKTGLAIPHRTGFLWAKEGTPWQT